MERNEDITIDDIEIMYDGEYPCLCMGTLVVKVKGKSYDFGKYVLISGGSCGFTDEEYTNSFIDEGEWSIDEDRWPENFPEKCKELVIDKINQEIPWGCCGGCL